MIIVKYGDLKKKQKKTRWNAKCDECGCKVIAEEFRKAGENHSEE